MADTLVTVAGVPHVSQFAPGRSNFRCQAFCMAILSFFAYPYRRQWNFGNGEKTATNIADLADLIYVKYVGPDTREDTNGMFKWEAVDFFHLNGVGFFDLQTVVDSHNSDNLRHAMGAMNSSHIPVMLGINDESHLFQAKQQSDGSWARGTKMHNWDDRGLGHCIIRVGMDVQHPVTLIDDPATSCPPFAYPTPVLWEDVVACGINTALGIMGHGVSAPHADFNWLATGAQWPVPPPAVNLDRASQAVHGMDAPLQALKNMADALDSNHLHTVVGALEAGQKSILVDIGKG